MNLVFSNLHMLSLLKVISLVFDQPNKRTSPPAEMTEYEKAMSAFNTTTAIRSTGATISPAQAQTVIGDWEKVQKAKADRQEEIFGFRETIGIIRINDDDRFGFAFYNHETEDWNCLSGSFDRLYGFYEALSFMQESNDDLDECKICCWAFFQLNQQLQPVSIVPHAQLSVAQNNRMFGIQTTHEGTLRDLTSMSETFTPPKMVWEE